MQSKTPERRARDAHQARQRFLQSVRRRRVLAERAAALRGIIIQHRAFAQAHGLRPARDLTRVPIVLPTELSLTANYNETVGAVSEMRRLVLQEGRRVMLYFDHVKKLEPAATLLLTAEIYRCKNLMPSRRGPIVNGNYPVDRETFLQLRDMGFYRLIEGDSKEDIPDGREIEGRPYFVPFRTFRGVDPEFAAEFCQLALDGAFKMDDVVKGRMVGALKEAMGNAEEHAYSKKGELPTMVGRWWVTGYVDPAAREMMITFFDQGIGIPNCLDLELFDTVRSIIRTRTWGASDGYRIAAATDVFRTSTGLQGRGKGFRDMKRFVDKCQDGELRVLSNYGSYRYMQKSETIEDREVSIGGTIVEWRVRHSGVLEVSDA